jgi:hypothetical protein
LAARNFDAVVGVISTHRRERLVFSGARRPCLGGPADVAGSATAVLSEAERCRSGVERARWE